MPPTLASYRVLILDQFSGVTPSWLQDNPAITFDDLVAHFMGAEAQQTTWCKPRVETVPEDFRPRMATTVIRENSEGKPEVWKYRWDSSG